MHLGHDKNQNEKRVRPSLVKILHGIWWQLPPTIVLTLVHLDKCKIYMVHEFKNHSPLVNK